MDEDAAALVVLLAAADGSVTACPVVQDPGGDGAGWVIALPAGYVPAPGDELVIEHPAGGVLLAWSDDGT